MAGQDAPPPTILDFLSSWVKEKDIVKRSRIPTEKKLLAAVLCISGYTSRDASKVLGGMSHVAVHDSFKAVTAALPPVARQDRNVAIEENLVDFNPETHGVLWMARDVDTGEILALRCSVSKSADDSKRFIQAVLATCIGRPLLRVGRGPAFPQVLKGLDFYFRLDTTPATTRLRQRISSFFLGSSEPKG